MDVNDVINKQELLERIDDDIELLQDLIELFLEDYPQQISEIDTAIKTRDSAKLRSSAHTLKGSVGNFCADAAFEIAKKLEISGVENDFSSSVPDFAHLVTEMKRVELALSQLTREYSAG